MKFILILFSTVLLCISNYDKIELLISAASDDNKIIAKAPKIHISGEDLNRQYTSIADLYNLSEAVEVHFIVNELGEVKDPDFSNIDDGKAAGEIIDLIESEGITPGSVSGKPTSNGIGLTLKADASI